MAKKAPPAAAAAPPPTTAVAETAHQGEYKITRCDQIRKSPDNRKTFDLVALNELAASIKAIGVAQPIVIRPVTPTADEPEEFELVAGERRWRASIIAGVPTIPSMVRALSDLDAAKIRILENLQREDPHPLDEADGYQLLMMRHGYTADQLSSDVCKSKAYIYARLKLCALGPAVRERFLNNEIPASTALLIARIPVPELQLRAVGEILDVAPMSVREATQHIQTKYMLDLKLAPFQLTDAKLHPAAGACSTCPKRTGNQPEIYADISADVCTDPGCYTEKRAAVTERILATALKNGIPVFDAEEKCNEFCGMNSGMPSIRPMYHLRRAKGPSQYRSIGSILAPSLYPAAIAYLHLGGVLSAIYDRATLQAVFEEAGECGAEEPPPQELPGAGGHTPAQVKQLAKAKADADAYHERERLAEHESKFRFDLYTQLRSRARKGFRLESLREFVKLMLRNDHSYDVPTALLGVIGLTDAADATVCAYIDQATIAEVQLILVDMVLGGCLSVSGIDIEDGQVDDYDGRFAALRAMAAHEGIDHDHVREIHFPTPIRLESWQYADVLDFITKHPARINELKDTILASPYMDLVSVLERAARSIGYMYTIDGFQRPSTETSVADAACYLASDEAAPKADGAASGSETAPVDASRDADEGNEHLEEAMAGREAMAKWRNGRGKKVPLLTGKPHKAIAIVKSVEVTPGINAGDIPTVTVRLAPTNAWPFPKSRDDGLAKRVGAHDSAAASLASDDATSSAPDAPAIADDTITTTEA